MSAKHIVHGVNRYKAFACRCGVCKAAMSTYAKSRYVPTPPKPTTPPNRSWWLDAPLVGFTAYVEAQEYPRMRISRFGSGQGKPISTDELSR